MENNKIDIDLLEQETIQNNYNSIVSDENTLKPYYDKKIEDTLKTWIQKSKWVITEIDYNNSFLIYKTPKNLKFLKNDGSYLNLSLKYYCYFIEINTKTGEHKLRKISNHFLLWLDLESWELNELLTQKNLVEKLTYDLAQREKKYKWKIRIDTTSIQASLINYLPNKYEVYFRKHNGGIEKKVIEAWIVKHDQIKILAIYNLKKYSKKYSDIDRIYQIDFAKTIWAKLFVNTEKRKPLSLKDLTLFTFKLYKIYSAKPSTSFDVALEELIRTTNGNIRSTAIALKDITNEPATSSVEEAMKKLNEIDLAAGKKQNFNEVYLAMVSLINSSWVSAATVFFKIADMLERQVFLLRSVKNAIKKPLAIIFFLLCVMCFTIKSFSPIVYDIYDGLWLPRPALTVAVNSFIDFVTQYFVFVVLFLYITYIWFIYFSQQSYYGKKVIHNIYLTMPLFWWFFKRRDYEIFLSVAQQLYGWRKSHDILLPLLKQTVVNEHIKAVIYTAWYNFNVYKTVSPWETFMKFPQYIEERLANLFKKELVDTEEWWELEQLAYTYRLDNDEFISNLNSLISNSLLFIGWWIVMITFLWSIIPMIEVINEF